MSRLRVAMVSALATGGTAVHVCALAVGCAEAGLDVCVLAPESMIVETFTPPAMQSLHDHGIPVVSLRRIRTWIAQWRPDVVHAHGVRAGASAAAAIGLTRRRSRPALVVTVHNGPPQGLARSLLYGTLERVCARRADLVLCASADLLARIRRRGARRAEQFEVPAPLLPAPGPADVAALRSELGAGTRPVVLAVGRLAPQKGLDVLVDAAARWGGRDPRPVTVIAGDGPLAASLRARAQDSGADVRLLGARTDVPALLALAAVVVVPSRWEARALVVQEAMRAARPVVASRVGGIPELTGEDGALLVPPGDPGALATAVTAVLDDPGLAARLRLAASLRSRAFPTEEDAVHAAVGWYAGLAGRPAGAP